YEALIVRDSSLSASTQAIVAAEVGHLELAYDYFAEAALTDVHDLQDNTGDGVHIACLAGPLQRLAFGLHFRGRRLRVEATKTHARYVLLDGEPLEIAHHGTAGHGHGRRADPADGPAPCAEAARGPSAGAPRHGARRRLSPNRTAPSGGRGLVARRVPPRRSRVSPCPRTRPA